MPAAPSIPPPTVGTVIDNGALELVEILGYGGYGIVFKAVDRATAHSAYPVHYAVKCLTHAQAARQRQLHMREITLHKLASAHEGVVTLHRVLDDEHFTFIVMDYCPDGDLFSQILHQRTYLGYDRLIKHVFLQLIDAVEHCHSLGIYHRDLKPENVLCVDGGLRVAVTDFGLATTDKVSQEFRTGSVYHMSPECQGGRFAPTGSYSPLFNDVWSLGIILLNLATGRNPWKSATLNDPTFCAYLQRPHAFLPTVLPISPELNALLVRTLEPDWRKRLTLRELRRGVRALDNFYAEDVVFEHSMARCPWEASLEPDDEPSPSSSDAAQAEATRTPSPAQEAHVAAPAKPAVQAAAVEGAVSDWADADMLPSPEEAASWLEFDDGTEETTEVAAVRLVENLEEEEEEEEEEADEEDDYAAPGAAELTASRTWSAPPSSANDWIDADGDRSMSPSPSPTWVRALAGASSSTSSTPSSPRSVSSLPPTPRASAAFFPPTPATVALTIDTTRCAPSYFDGARYDPYDGDSSMWSACSSAMQTAVEAWAEEESVRPAAPWADSFLVLEPPKVPMHVSSPIAMDEEVFTSSDEEEEDAYAPLEFERASTGSSAAVSGGHDADIEDATMGPCSSPNALNAVAARVFFPPAAAAASSSSSSLGLPGALDAPAAATGGKRKARRRGSGRFNPLKFALRSLSPSRTRSRSPAPSVPSSSPASRRPAWATPASAPATVTVFAAARPAYVFGSGAHAAFGFDAAAAEAEEQRGRGQWLRPAKRSWFSPRRRLFAAA